MIKKIQICSISLNFYDEKEDVKTKKDRLEYFEELLKHLRDESYVEKFIIPHFDLLMNMIENNIFRSLPNLKKANSV